MVDEGVSGYLVPPRDVAAFAQKLGQLITDPDKASKMGRAGRARYLEYFTFEQHLAQMEQLFVEVHET
jgi:glycosyltransferase involved in cell wall biosynthesis